MLGCLLGFHINAITIVLVNESDQATVKTTIEGRAITLSPKHYAKTTRSELQQIFWVSDSLKVPFAQCVDAMFYEPSKNPEIIFIFRFEIKGLDRVNYPFSYGLSGITGKGNLLSYEGRLRNDGYHEIILKTADAKK